MSARRGDRRRWQRPSARDLLDLGFLAALCVIALLGLAASYTGVGFAVAGLAGLLIGGGAVVFARGLGWPFIAPVLLVVAAYFLLGGAVALRSEGPWAALPVPSTLALLADQLVFGWKDLLTTLPPVDGDGPLLVLPWVLGLVAGTTGTLLTGVRRGPAWLVGALPLTAPVLLLLAVILLGIDRPASLWLQGAGFAVLAITWLALRAQRASARMQGSTGQRRRVASGLALLVIAGALAMPLGDRLAGDDERVILRSYVEPPFEIGQYPSPLASFRRYVEMPEPDAANLHEETLMAVRGVPAGTRVRIATLDTYDGSVWGAADDSEPGSGFGTFQRVSSRIANPAQGEPVEVTVELGPGWSGVWLPTVGALTGMSFVEGDVDAMAQSFRYNLATSSAVVPSGVGPGDAYSFTAVLPDDELPTGTVAPWPQQNDDASVAAFLDTQALQWSEGENEPLDRVRAVANHLLVEGKFSDGVDAAERRYLPGHSLFRLGDEFVNAPIMVGNAEQYAAVMALLANRLRVPARVVFGAVLPQGGVVQGKHVTAWVELRLADGSWYTLPTEEFMDFDKPADQPPITQQEMSGSVVPPPAPVPPPSELGDQSDAELSARQGEDDEESGWQLPAWLVALLLYAGPPLLAILLVLGAIVVAKVVRRRRRRSAPRVSARFVGGWLELTDTARDLGRPVPPRATRREQAVALAHAPPPVAPPPVAQPPVAQPPVAQHPVAQPSVAQPPVASGPVVLARRADAHVFGPRDPDADAAAAYWESVEAERRAMREGVSRRRRVLAAISLASFRRR